MYVYQTLIGLTIARLNFRVIMKSKKLLLLLHFNIFWLSQKKQMVLID